jgi:CheY-like chemotaxis protein
MLGHNVLLVEDNPADARLCSEALRETASTSDLHVVPDGEAALSFLRREGEWKDAPIPDLVLLDLNLPKKSGREVLAEYVDVMRQISSFWLSTVKLPERD